MNERQDYASTDLKRRPFKTAIMITGMTIVVAFTMFLFLFANTLLDVTFYITSANFMHSLSIFFETFIGAILLLVMVLGVVIFSSMISLEMVSRRKDIGLMKAIGTMIDTVYDHFMAQAVILLLASVVLGTSIGTLLYFAGMLWLSTVIPNLQFAGVFPILPVAFLAFLYLFVGYFAAQKPIYDAVHELPLTTLNPVLGTRVRKVGYLDSFGLSFKIATKATGRRIKGSRRTLLSLFLSITLASVLWIGGGVVQTTTSSYISRSMGTNIVAIGSSQVLNSYEAAYTLGNGHLANQTLVNASNLIPSDLLDDLQAIPAISHIEERLIEETTIHEGPAIVWNPTLEQWERIGQDRDASALVMGIDWTHTLSDWYFEGDPINATNQAWIGGMLATTAYDDPLVQTLQLQGASLDIRGIAFDIANDGLVALMDLETMKSLWKVSLPNLVLVQLDYYTNDTIAQIAQVAQNYGLQVFAQQYLLDSNIATLNAIWYLLQPLSVMALLSAFVALMNYLLVSVFSRFRDYVIMRSIGAKPSFLAKTIIAEGLSTGFTAGIPGIFVAILLSLYALVPEAAIPGLLYLPVSFGLMIGALVIVTVLAALPVYLLFSSKMEFRVSEFQV
ncbi:MAG: ABC transporter permease [Candidatus Thorarchaeota archaeon]|nr:ABC transporter permease [Candidatus Thorarchaeota archaeon]